MGSNNAFHAMRRSLSGGQDEAILRKVWLAGGGEQGGEEAVQALLRNEMRVVLMNNTVTLVDGNGRCIPINGLKGEVVDVNRDFRLVQPEIDYSTILSRLQQFFASEMKFVSLEEFEIRSAALIARIRDDKQVVNLLKGVYLPICLPQITVADYGRTLEDIFLPAVECAYKAQFPNRSFYNYRAGELASQVGIVEESRHQRLIEKMSEGPVVLIHFPNPLQGFPIPADRKMIGAFPEGFMLSGAIDTATSLVAHPATLARDWNMPGLDCSPNSWQSAGYSLYFKAHGDLLLFGRRSPLADDGCSGGLSFVG